MLSATLSLPQWPSKWVPAASLSQTNTNNDLWVYETSFLWLCMFSFSLDRGSYTKGLPQIRIDRDSENNSFFWRKSSETDLWMNYPKIQQDQHKITNTILPLHDNIFIFHHSLFNKCFLLLFMWGFKSEWINEVGVCLKTLWWYWDLMRTYTRSQCSSAAWWFLQKTKGLPMVSCMQFSWDTIS